LKIHLLGKGAQLFSTPTAHWNSLGAFKTTSILEYPEVLFQWIRGWLDIVICEFLYVLMCFQGLRFTEVEERRRLGLG
jgi:hypothetical protein